MPPEKEDLDSTKYLVNSYKERWTKADALYDVSDPVDSSD